MVCRCSAAGAQIVDGFDIIGNRLGLPCVLFLHDCLQMRLRWQEDKNNQPLVNSVSRVICQRVCACKGGMVTAAATGRPSAAGMCTWMAAATIGSRCGPVWRPSKRT